MDREFLCQMSNPIQVIYMFYQHDEDFAILQEIHKQDEELIEIIEAVQPRAKSVHLFFKQTFI